MLPTRKFKLGLVLASLVVISTMLAACSESSLASLAAASATQGNDDSTATASPTATISPTVTISSTATTSPTATPTTEKDEQEIELKGTIQAITGNSITVNGQTFTVTPEMLARLGSQLKVGATIELQARSAGGVLMVVRI